MATAAVTRTIEEEVNLDLENLLGHSSSSKAPLKSMLISKYIILLLKIIVPNTWYGTIIPGTGIKKQRPITNYLACLVLFQEQWNVSHTVLLAAPSFSLLFQHSSSCHPLNRLQNILRLLGTPCPCEKAPYRRTSTIWYRRH